MESANNAVNSTPKSSLSKSLKKSLKSRSKISKSNIISIIPTSSTVQETPTTSNTPETLKDKVHSRNYAGFGTKSIRVIWEQHDTSDIEVSSDVYPRLAEDVTYKLWELVNHIKTYSTHSGGKVTFDLVNEVLKDVDAAPVLGAGDNEWDKIEYDGTFFFNSDKVVLLRDEYISDVQRESVNGLELISSWVIDRRFSKNLLEFISFLCNALFLGDDESYKFALDTAAFSPQIGCSLKLLLKKIVEMLAFEQKFETIDRSLAFLRSLSFNPYARDVECREQLFNLSEILICLLLGTYESILPQKEQKEESFELVTNFLGSSDQEMKKEVEILNQMDVEDIRSEYEALFQMMERDGFQERENPEIVVGDDKHNSSKIMNRNDGVERGTTSRSGATTRAEKIDLNTIKQESVEPTAVIKQEDECSDDEDNNFMDVDMSPYRAQMCYLIHVDAVCSTVGCLGSQFGYLQNECTYLIQRRMEKFFDFKKYFEEPEYLFISRCIRGLISLGEYAFREIIPFLYKINPLNAPEWIQNHFSSSAIFLHGRDDIFLYEWLEELCGYKLQPFMLHYYKYHQKLTTKRFKQYKRPTYKVNPKIYFKKLEKKLSKQKFNLKEVFFPDASTFSLEKSSKKISFRYSGCRPIIIKPKFKNQYRSDAITSFQQHTPNFNAHIIIGKRKLQKPLSNKKKVVNLSNYCFLQI